MTKNVAVAFCTANLVPCSPRNELNAPEVALRPELVARSKLPVLERLPSSQINCWFRSTKANFGTPSKLSGDKGSNSKAGLVIKKGASADCAQRRIRVALMRR